MMRRLALLLLALPVGASRNTGPRRPLRAATPPPVRVLVRSSDSTVSPRIYVRVIGFGAAIRQGDATGALVTLQDGHAAASPPLVVEMFDGPTTVVLATEPRDPELRVELRPPAPAPGRVVHDVEAGGHEVELRCDSAGVVSVSGEWMRSRERRGGAARAW